MNVEAGPGQGSAAGRGYSQRLRRQRDAPAPPEMRVDSTGHVRPAEHPDSPSIPVVWSKWPWLHTMARSSLVDVEPAHVLHHPVRAGPRVEQDPVVTPSLVTVTSTEKSMLGDQCVPETGRSITAAGRRGRRAESAAGPWFGHENVVTLSISVVTMTESTGSRSISTAGSTSYPVAATGHPGCRRRTWASLINAAPY